MFSIGKTKSTAGIKPFKIFANVKCKVEEQSKHGAQKHILKGPFQSIFDLSSLAELVSAPTNIIVKILSCVYFCRSEIAF